LPEKRRDILWERATLGQDRKNILDVDHANNIVQIPAVNGDPAVAVFGENFHEIAKRRAFLDGYYVGARDRDIVDPMLAEMQHVAQHFEFQR